MSRRMLVPRDQLAARLAEVARCPHCGQQMTTFQSLPAQGPHVKTHVRVEWRCLNIGCSGKGQRS